MSASSGRSETGPQLFRVAGTVLGLTERTSRVVGTEETRQQEMREEKQRGSEGLVLQAVTLTGVPGPRGKRIQRGGGRVRQEPDTFQGPSVTSGMGHVP